MTPVNREPLADLLERWGACNEALEWAGSYGLEYERAWLECERGDWMIRWLRHLDVTDSMLRLVACDIARSVLHLVPEGEDRPREAIEVSERYAVGEASREELVAARSAAYAADASDASAAAYAASAAAYAASASAAASDASAYAAAAASASDAASDASAYAAAAAARAEHAEIVRRRCDGMTFGKREDLR